MQPACAVNGFRELMFLCFSAYFCSAGSVFQDAGLRQIRKFTARPLFKGNVSLTSERAKYEGIPVISLGNRSEC
jgi:hypothetical protein